VLEWKIVERVNREDNAKQIQPKRFLVDLVKIQTQKSVRKTSHREKCRSKL
jgi:hypothetical protein